MDAQALEKVAELLRDLSETTTLKWDFPRIQENKITVIAPIEPKRPEGDQRPSGETLPRYLVRLEVFETRSPGFEVSVLTQFPDGSDGRQVLSVSEHKMGPTFNKAHKLFQAWLNATSQVYQELRLPSYIEDEDDE